MAKIKIIGLKELMRNLKRMGADVGGEARIALEKTGQHLENEIKITLSHRWGPRTGKIYATRKEGARYQQHQASAPREPPAVLSGELMGSITHKAEKISKIRAEGAVGTNLEYAEGLERGTSKMFPRPFIFPTIAKEAKNVSGIIRKSLSNSLKKYARK